MKRKNTNATWKFKDLKTKCAGQHRLTEHQFLYNNLIDTSIIYVKHEYNNIKRRSLKP